MARRWPGRARFRPGCCGSWSSAIALPSDGARRAPRGMDWRRDSPLDSQPCGRKYPGQCGLSSVGDRADRRKPVSSRDRAGTARTRDLRRERRSARLHHGVSPPTKPPWVTDLPDVSLRPSNPSWSRAAFGTFIALDNAAFVRAARAHGAHVLPFSAISRESEANRAPYVSNDGLHPSAAGYAKLADALWPSFEAALRPERSFKQKRS